MSFKKKQLTGFGIILLLMIVLITGIFFMINNMKNNMLEIVEDRYYKVNLVTEMRQLFFQSDRELLNSVYEKDKTQVNDSLEQLKQNHDLIQKDLYTLSGILNHKQSYIYLNEIEENYKAYINIENKITEKVRDGKLNEIQPLLTEQKVNRTLVIRNMNDFKAYQESLMKSTLKSAKSTYQKGLYTLILGALLALAATAMVAYWVIKSTTNNLKNISDVMKTIDFTDMSTLPRITVGTKDEIGDIAVAFNEMAYSLEESSRKEKEFTSKIEEQNWVQTGLAEMATMYQRIEDLDMLAARFLSKLAPMMDASYAVFYARVGEGKNARYRKLASFAGEGQNAGRMEFLPGEGLIGQAALEKRAHILEEIPEGYTFITSGLGEVFPKSIMIVPVLFEDEVVAMVELASLENIQEVKRKFLVQALDTLGLTINSVKGRMEIERLLKESQAQTEELQMQSEELQTQSEELHRQKRCNPNQKSSA
ncbi:MCP four helix bundle domain-containing protein [Neobacillus sp. PS3-34]|nr:MCP four helix bundle domain-containing protein [Neobacillus sp. PS3-34]WML48782.1 MCP four helix bundle domain-containing protein [Neobacillus sp. PS3-34]